MKALIGLESQNSFEQSLAMLTALWPEGLDVEILNAVDCAKAYPGYGLFPAPDLPGQLVDTLDRESRRLAKWAEGEAAGKCGSAITKIKWGTPAAELLEESDACGADVIAVHRRNVSGVGRLFLGSVSRAVLLAAKQSILVTKGAQSAPKDLTAVVAMDHSQYSKNCVDLLLSMQAKGIKRILIATAIEPAQARQSKSAEALEFHLREANEELCTKFKANGIEAMYEVAEGMPNKVLRDAMATASADLIIVGAQGHGFVERLLMGSTSLHQVAVEPYPVLVLRV